MNRRRPIAAWIAFAAFIIAAMPAFAQTRPATTKLSAATSPATTRAVEARRAPESMIGSTAVVVPFEGDVDEFNRDQLFRRIEKAREMGAKTIIIRLNSYGGLVHAGLDISRYLKQQDDLYIVAYVEDKAISAGAMMAAAMDEIVMEPHAQIGAAGVIMATATGGLQEIGETERAKFESPVLEDFYDSAVTNDYDPTLLKGMVTIKSAIYFLENAATGERRITDKATRDQLVESGQWQSVPGVRDPIKAEGELLTLSTDLAMKVGLASGQYNSIDAFAADRSLKVIATLEPGVGERAIGFLSSAAVRGLLMTILMFSLYMAFSAPGHGGAEAVAMVALAVLLGVPLLTGYAGWIEIVAIILGIALLAIEIFVLPGFGVAGITGLILVLGALVMTFVPPLKLPGLPAGFGVSFNAIMNGVVIVAAALACSLLLWVWLNRYLPRLPYFNKLILTSVAGDIEADELTRPPAEGPAVGDVGVAVTDLKPGGSVKFITESYPDGRIAGVVSDTGFLPAGTSVKVREVAGNRVVVRRQDLS